jgi:LPS sulfotransferase NodH
MNRIQEILSRNIYDKAIDLELKDEELFEKGYVILFTPRSGSTYLSRLLENTLSLGIPREWFNLKKIERMAPSVGINDIRVYNRYIRCRKKSSNDVFGLEITSGQLKNLNDLLPFEELFKDIDNYFFLYRDNFILQSISLYKSDVTKVFHSVNFSGVNNKNNKNYDSKVLYNNKEIKIRINRIMDFESKIHDFIQKQDINVFKLTYESLNTSPEIIIHGIANILGEKIKKKDYKRGIKIKKLPVGKTLEFYHRFIQEEKEFIKGCIDKRKALAELDSLFYDNFNSY